MMRPLLAVLGLLGAPACMMTSEPASPCPALDLGHADPATFVAPSTAPIVAITSAEESFVAHPVCDNDGNCEVRKTPLSWSDDAGDPQPLPAGTQVLVTASGRWVVAADTRDGQTIIGAWQVNTDEQHGVQQLGKPIRVKPLILLASLRGTDDEDWIVARAEGPRKLVRLRASDLHQVDSAAVSDDVVEPIADVDGLLVVTVGERFLVGRQPDGGGEETLYLVDVRDDHEHARPLVRGPTFSRVVLTPGDAMVIATVGTGVDAETFVFDVQDGVLLDRFRGAAISGRKRAEELPGLRAVSPDGSTLAYRTPAGSLALRSLDSQSSCIVRSANGGRHEIAGFSAAGVLFLETTNNSGDDRVFAFDPRVRRLAALGDPEKPARLFAVPARDLVQSDAAPGQWALARVGVDNHFEAILEDGVAQSLTFSSGSGEALARDAADVAVVPRDDTGLAIVATRRIEGSSSRNLSVHRVQPIATANRSMQIDRKPPVFEVISGNASPVPLSLRLESQAPTCVSTGGPGMAGFGCSRGGGSSLFEFSPADSEQASPEAPPIPQPVAKPPPADDDDDS